MVTNKLHGLGSKFESLLLKRFELTTFYFSFSKNTHILTYFNNSYKSLVKTLNILFSQINNVNSTTLELRRLNILRKYLIKSYQGYCHSVGKPVRGQRTWSNGWNSFKCNNTLRSFINKVKHLQSSNKNDQTKVDYRKIKKKYTLKTNFGKVLSKDKFSKSSQIRKIIWH
jgi:ribosomal protein S13